MKYVLVCLGVRVWLYIGKFIIKELFGVVNCEVFGYVDILVIVVIVMVWIVFGVFVGYDRVLCFYYGGGNDVFGCD